MKTIFRYLAIVIALPAIYLASVILFGTITNFKPDENTTISSMEDGFAISGTAEYSALIYNIGYCGLGANMDFFYDGGTKVRDTEENTRRNLFHITSWLQLVDTVDFMLLQEVDKKSRRSYHINQVEHLNMALAGYFPFFALNYNAKFVPLPLLRPMGRVESGLLTLSKHVPQSSVRFSFPGNYSWPKSSFMLDRCFLVNRYRLEAGNELLIINTHNSAYDDGTLRDKQKEYLKTFIESEAGKGNHLLIGGDWNECPPGFMPRFDGHVFDTVNLHYIDKNYMPDTWKWGYDSTQPTNRRVVTAYEKGSCPVTLIDFFLVSPGIEILECKTFSTGFSHSDHQPVMIKFRLKQ
ncbi:MAG: endonuclease/exonuclease/phosphatase family protein [Bacteroidales bacterium]|nr:endonuclease/exonuclease/phosphatase family protein [Bacteroidales bacterium]